MNIVLKAVTVLIVGMLALLSVFAPASGQGATGTVNVQVVYCPSLWQATEIVSVTPDCSPGPGQFSFYLIGDGTADYELLDVPLSGSASIDLPVGDYEVYEETTGVKMIIEVRAGAPVTRIVGIPSEAGPETPSGEFYISAWACPGATAVAFTDVVPGDCTRIATQMSFYLIGDGTDAHYPMPTLDTGAMRTSLPLGDYEVVHEPTQTHLFMTVSQNTGDVHLIVPADPEPEPANGDFYISAWECTSVTAVAFTDVVPGDCVRIATDLSYYLIGDGTAMYYPVPTLATGAMLVSLPLGDYQVVHEASQVHLFMTVSGETGDVHLVVPKAKAPVTPAPTSVPQPTAAPKPTAATVTKLPSTGSGPEANAAVLGAIVAGAVVSAGAIGMRLRKG